MRILFLGNSFTYFHDLPHIVSHMLSCEVQAHTRGGARLSEQLNPETEMGAKTLKALKEEKWDYVVMQEQSFAPVGSFDAFLNSVKALSALIKENGATPVLYASWAYKEGTEKLTSTNLSYTEMADALRNNYQKAAESSGALMADVGTLFTKTRDIITPYEPDNYHPSEAGTALAAGEIARVILENEWKRNN
ncbi:MAG: SGNH/GDSL hydrolase family protein [Clostridia bacterium]|nr:SGNH/GDSL hydrolase family protein [Clostridia bacterium]